METEDHSNISATIQGALAKSTRVLECNGVSEARLDAGSLLAHVIGRDRTFLIAHADKMLTPQQLAKFESLIARRAGGEPLQYINGHQEFFRLDFEVTPDVLIPRPETELIVETALALMRGNRALSFVDIGTGSGCIAISLLREWPDAQAIATDISSAALKVARRNAERHGVANRLRLIRSDGFAEIDPARFDFVVSNPPYVPDGDLVTLQREVQHEPQSALAGGSDGLSVIRRLLCDAPQFLRPGGHFVFEIGFSQSEAVKALIDDSIWELLEISVDLASIPRAVVLRKR